MDNEIAHSPRAPERRAMLAWIAAASGAFAGLLALVPSIRAFLAPLRRKPSEPNWVRLTDTSLIDPGTPIRIDFAETVQDAWVASRELRNVWILTEDGEKFTVYSGVCTHLGCSYGFDTEPNEFHSQANIFHCPCHHALFEPKTGAVLGGPAPRPLDRLEAKIEKGILYTQYKRFRVGVPERVEL